MAFTPGQIDRTGRRPTQARPFYKGVLVVVLGLLLSGPVQATDSSRVREYTHNLLAGEDVPFPGLVIDSHPALPWLKMAWMRARLDELDPSEVTSFISRYRDRPFTAEFRRDWLVSLGRTGRWRDFARHYQGERDQTLRCYAHQARLHAGQQETAHRRAAALWLTGRTLPEACDPVFESAREAGAITDYMVAERFRLAMRAENLGLAESLAPMVGGSAMDQVHRAVALRDDPVSVLEGIDPATANHSQTVLASRAIREIARDDPRDARHRWDAVQAEGLRPSGYQRFLVQRRLALEAAREHLPEATEWLAETPAEDRFIQTWRVRNALRTQNWAGVIEAIDNHPERNERQWRYWRARALEQTGNESNAGRVFQHLADRHDYYGILAARRIGAGLEQRLSPIEPESSTLDRLADDPGLERARALLDLGWSSAASAEWRAALEARPRSVRCQAALLAARWDWASEAVITAGRSGCRGDPDIDYPFAFAERMRDRSESLSLDAAWAWSIMRSESLFNVEARSHVGALGLMQLMPATAREMAEVVGIEINGERDILDPARNIQLGTGYLRRMLDQFDDHPLVATAAYNAGPHRAEDWLPRAGAIPGDVWAETIPFRETRQYIRRVMQHSLRYDQRMGRGIDGLTRRLGPVVSDAMAGCSLPTEDGTTPPDAC